MDIGLLSAFIGGALALLSPCAALLMPAFFASTVGAGSRLVLHGALFYLGMLLVLVPLGLGAGSLGALFTAHRQEVVLTASILLIVLGIIQLLGFGFDPAKLMPGAAGARTRTARATGWTKTFLLGATSGIAGVCAGPILGAVLTLAAARGDVVASGFMLAVYGAGMVAPLLLIAALWNRLGTRGRALLRGREITIFRRHLHTTSLLTGALMIIVGIVFWSTNGLVSVPSLVPTDVLARLQSSPLLSSTAVDIAAVLAIAGVILAVWFWKNRDHTDQSGISQSRASRSRASQTSTEGAADDPDRP